MPLAARQRSPGLTHLGVQTLRQRGDLRRQPRLRQRRREHRIRRISETGPLEHEVVAHGPREDGGLLGKQRGTGIRPGQGALGGLEKSQENGSQSGLAAAGRADDTDVLAGAQHQVDVAKDRQ